MNFKILLILLLLTTGCSATQYPSCLTFKDGTTYCHPYDYPIDCKYAIKICQIDTDGDGLKDSDCEYGEPCLE